MRLIFLKSKKIESIFLLYVRYIKYKLHEYLYYIKGGEYYEHITITKNGVCR